MAVNAEMSRGFKFLNLTPNNVADDLIVSNCPGMLHTLTCNMMPTTAGILNLYDGIDNTGTLIANITLPNGQADDFVVTTLLFDAKLDTGLYVVGDGTLAGFDFTITYI